MKSVFSSVKWNSKTLQSKRKLFSLLHFPRHCQPLQVILTTSQLFHLMSSHLIWVGRELGSIRVSPANHREAWVCLCPIPLKLRHNIVPLTRLNYCWPRTLLNMAYFTQCILNFLVQWTKCLWFSHAGITCLLSQNSPKKFWAKSDNFSSNFYILLPLKILKGLRWLKHKNWLKYYRSPLDPSLIAIWLPLINATFFLNRKWTVYL